VIDRVYVRAEALIPVVSAITSPIAFSG